MIKFYGLCLSGLLIASTPLHAAVRTSNMNEDILVTQSLSAALKGAVGTVPAVQSDGTTTTLAAGDDKLACADSGCTLSWDTNSQNASQSASVFENALYNVLLKWTSGAGANDPATHKVVYAQTGSVQITIAEGFGSDDQVECSAIVSAGLTATPYIDCSLMVSDIRTGADADLRALYERLLQAPTLIGDSVQALLGVFKSPQYLPYGSTENGGGTVQAVHTLYTDLLEDGLVVSMNYAFVTPIKNSAGQVIADGTTLTLTGSQDGTSTLGVQQAQVQAYALMQPIPLGKLRNPLLHTRAMAQLKAKAVK